MQLAFHALIGKKMPEDLFDFLLDEDQAFITLPKLMSSSLEENTAVNVFVPACSDTEEYQTENEEAVSSTKKRGSYKKKPSPNTQEKRESTRKKTVPSRYTVSGNWDSSSSRPQRGTRTKRKPKPATVAPVKSGRYFYTEEQTNLLLSCFEDYLDQPWEWKKRSSNFQALCQISGLSSRQVEKWFYRRRVSYLQRHAGGVGVKVTKKTPARFVLCCMRDGSLMMIA